MATLKDLLDTRAAPAAPELTEDLSGNRVRCRACGHRCRIKEGLRGNCKVRFNRGGALMAPSGYVAGLQADPVEKKPFYHALPGALALSFGMLGCDLHCGYCQNWLTSQAIRDDAAGTPVRSITAAEIVATAVRHGAPVITSTYNEPLVTAEWAAATFDLAREEGLLTSFVSNGHGTPEVLEFLAPRLDIMKIDLKSFRADTYRELGGRLECVLETIQGAVSRGIWVEIVTLVVPGLNDSIEELTDIAAFLAGVSPDIPWHVTAFHPDYRMKDRGFTSPETLVTAAEIGRAAGLRYVYAGNAPGRVGNHEDTVCPSCGKALVTRRGYRIQESLIGEDGSCPACHTPIAGRWHRGLRA